MKVELELTEQQLKELDNGLNNLLQNLSEKQKLEIVKAYMIKQFDGIYYEKIDTWGCTRTELTDFGRTLIKELQDKITQAASDKIIEQLLENKEINNCIKLVEKDLPQIIEKSISQYIVDNLFRNKNDLQQQIYEIIYKYRMENNSTNYN